MMARMSRAGRKKEIKAVLRRYRFTNRKGYLTVGQIANRMGLKSSTFLKNVLREMQEHDEEIIHLQQGDMDMWRYQPYEQISFWDRDVVINGKPTTARDWLHEVSPL